MGGATYYTWTADGEMATKHEAAGWTGDRRRSRYTWDVDESLTKIEAPQTTLENRYNSRMQRVWRREDGDASDLVYDSDKLIAEATGGGLGRYYLSEGGGAYSPLVSQLGSQHWFLFDALGTTLGLAASNGSLSDMFRYEAFGTSLGRTGTTATPYQYVGGYGYFHEPNVGLEQVWWRWLALRNGWVSRDPARQGVSLYAYVGNGAPNWRDPSGQTMGEWPPESNVPTIPPGTYILPIEVYPDPRRTLAGILLLCWLLALLTQLAETIRGEENMPHEYPEPEWPLNPGWGPLY